MAKKTAVETSGMDGSKDRLAQLLASELLEKIKKKHGTTILERASDFRVQQVSRIPTGIFMLDYALGGGFPAGRVNLVYGPKSSSKTTTILKAIANAQKMCASCWSFKNDAGECACKTPRDAVIAFMDVEGAFDINWAKTIGVDTGRLLLSVPEYAEQAIDIADALLRSGDVDILILDSIAFLEPTRESEEAMDKELPGLQARLVGKGVRKFISAQNAVGNASGRRPTIFFTNQIRQKVGVMYGSPDVCPGGMAPGFAASTEIKFWPGKYELDETTGKPLHVDMNFRIDKNKVSSAKMEGEYRLILAKTETKNVGDVYDEDKIVDLGVKFGLIEGSGPGGWRCFGESFSAKSKMERELLINPEYRSRVKTALMQILLSL